MTETYNPFGAVEESAPAVDEPAADSRRNLVALGGLAAVLLAGGAYFLLSGGEDVVEDVAFTPSTTRTTVSASPAPAAVKLPVVTKVPLGRNPFKALYVQPAAAAPAPAQTTPLVTSTGAPTTGSPIVIVVPTPGPTGATPTSSSAPASSLSTVSLTKVDGSGADAVGTFVYDGKTLTGGKGDVMAGKLLVVSLQKTATGTWYAYLKLGEGPKFEVHKGQTVVVQ